MSFIDELKDIFHNKEAFAIKALREEIRIIVQERDALWTTVRATGSYRFLNDMDDATITNFLSAVFETDDVVKENYGNPNENSIGWCHISENGSCLNKDYVGGAKAGISISWNLNK